MTTTSERKRRDGAAEVGALRPAVLVAPRARRRPGLLVAGVAMVALGALAVVWLVSASGHRVDVVLVARDVPYGQTIRSGDLTTTPVSVDSSVAVVPASQIGKLVGTVATSNLAAGSLLTLSEVSSTGVLKAGEVLVPLPLAGDRVPAGGLEAGQRLEVVDAPPSGADPPPASPRTVTGTVMRVGKPDVNATVVVDLVAATTDGPVLATRAATGRFAIVVLPAVTP